MCCLALLAGFLGPRLAAVVWWLADPTRWDLAFSSWVWPLLGIIFLPWTTLAYVLVWSTVGGVEGLEWLVVGLGFAADLATYSARAAKSRYQTTTFQ
jgi:hypothetical protein